MSAAPDLAWGITDGSCDCPEGAACVSPGKHPTRKPYANANPIVRTDGEIFVIDLDVKPGKNGVESFRALIALHGALPHTRTVRTGSGGLHIYLRRPPGARVLNSAGKLGPGIDVRGDGGYVIGPGAKHVSGRRYELIRDLPAALAPAWLLPLVTLRASPAPHTETPRTFPPASSDELEAARLALDELGPAIEGQGGDAHTFKAAALLSNDFALTEEEAWPILWAWNQSCSPPWDDHELAAKMRGGAKYASGVFGCRRRSLAPLAAVKEVFTGWPRTEETLPLLLERVREIMHPGVSSDDHVVITNYLRGETGWSAKQLNLPRAVDLQMLAERKQRREALEAGDPELIDSRAPLSTARQFLRSTADAEGFPAFVQHNGDGYKATDLNHYRPHADDETNADLYAFLDGKREVENNAPIKPDRTLVEVTAHALRAEALIPATVSPPAWLGEPREHSADEIIAFPNGLLHQPTRTWFRSTRAFFATSAVGFNYDTNAPTPRHWLSFLEQLWPDDLESQHTLQEWFGLSITSDTSFQKGLIPIGPPRSGKGTIGRVLTGLVGAENVTAPTLSSLGGPFGMQSLIGKPLAILSDVRVSGRTDLGVVGENLLRVIGEDTVSVARKNREDWIGKLPTRFLMFTNEVPAFMDASGALASRFIMLRLTQSFLGREDRGLEGRLLNELPGILLWALEGLDRLRERGHFLQPASAKELVAQLAELSSPITSFVAERCVVAPGATVACADLYAVWRMWASEQGRDHVGTINIFSRDLGAAFPAIKTVRPRVSGRQVRHFEGIRLAESQ